MLPVRQLDLISRGVSGKRILIVGPGAIPIPTVGWGAVETIISETLPIYSTMGHDIWLINSRHPIDWREIRKMKFDLVLSHSDYHAKKLRYYFPRVHRIGISHYGLAAFPEKWHRSYKNTLKNLDGYSTLVCLSPAVFETYKELFDPKKLLISANGTTFNPKLGLEKNGKFLCIGKVEARKQQFEIYHEFKNAGLQVDFFGPISDNRVELLVLNDEIAAEWFKGPATREELVNQISSYEALILFSGGEGDALVLYEAQMAGLPIFVTEEALGSQDPQLPWIKVVSKAYSPTDLSRILNEIPGQSLDISTYAQQNYNWETRNIPILNRIQEVLK
jgi:hypothetical protein